MKLPLITNYTIPLVGALCLLEGMHTPPMEVGFLSVLYIIAGAFLIGLVIFELDTRLLGPFGLIGLLGIGLVGGAIWIVTRWGSGQWATAYPFALVWLLAAGGVALAISEQIQAWWREL